MPSAACSRATARSEAAGRPSGRPLVTRTPPAQASTEDGAVVDDTAALAARQKARAAAQHFIAKAPSTWQAYRTDWDTFTRWCATAALEPLPATPKTVALFLAALAAAGLSPSTLIRRIAAIRASHERSGQPSPHAAPAVKEVLAGARSDWGQSAWQKQAMLANDIKQLVDHCDTETRGGLRDRALLLLGFAAARRLAVPPSSSR